MFSPVNVAIIKFRIYEQWNWNHFQLTVYILQFTQIISENNNEKFSTSGKRQRIRVVVVVVVYLQRIEHSQFLSILKFIFIVCCTFQNWNSFVTKLRPSCPKWCLIQRTNKKWKRLLLSIVDCRFNLFCCHSNVSCFVCVSRGYITVHN